MNILIVWVLTALAVMLGAYVIPGVTVSSFGVSLIVALLIGLVNVTIRPLILLITLPINILTLGLFTFVINALMILLVAKVVDGFSVSSFWTALLMALVLSLLTSIFTEK